MLLVVAGSWRCALTSPGDYNDTSRFNKQSKRSRLRSRLRLRLRLRPLACFLLYFAFALGSFDNNCRFAENFQCHHRILQVLQAFCHSLHNRKQTHRLTLNRQTGTDTDTGTDTHRYTHTHTLSLSTWPHPPPDFVGRRRADAFSPSETTKKAKAKADRAPKLRRKCGHKQACKVQASERFSPGWCGCNVVVCVCACVRDAIKNQGSAASTAAVSSEPDINWDHFYKEVHKTYKNSNQWHETNAGICFNCQAL